MANQKYNKDNNNTDFVEHLVSVNRVAKVVKGGRRFGFAAIVVVGNSQGKVGYGTGKAKEIPNAILPSTNIRGEIEYQGVTFSYVKGKPAVENLSLKIQPGEKIALVGHTGSGKSTLVKLLNISLALFCALVFKSAFISLSISSWLKNSISVLWNLNTYPSKGS